MDSKNSELYEDAVSKVESVIEDSNSNKMKINDINNINKIENNNNEYIYFKSSEYYDKDLNNNNNNQNSQTKFDNNEIQKSCCQTSKCNIY